MGVKVHGELDESIPDIPAGAMLDGQTAVITSCDFRMFLGETVRRDGDGLYLMNRPSAMGWRCFFPNSNSNLRVRILPPGALLEIT